MGTSKRYNSVPVKDNCAMFTHLLFWRLGSLTVLFKFTPYHPCCHSKHLKVAKFWITANGDFKAVSIGPRKK